MNLYLVENGKLITTNTTDNILEGVTRNTVKEFATDVLGLEVYGRIDFILSKENNEFYCLEANTLPGMTPMSLMPQEAAAAGIAYGELCEMIAKTAYDK